jgi:hypothetical protein
MNIDDLKTTWREEMDNTSQIGNFSLSKITAEANELNRQTRFGGFIFALTAIGMSSIIGLVWFGGVVEHTPIRFFGNIAMPLLYAYVAYLYFNSAKASSEEGWTLATRLASEIEKKEKQFKLYSGLPFRFVLPAFSLILITSYAGYQQRTGNYMPDTGLFLLFLGSMVLFSITLWGLKWEKRKKITPMLNKLQALQAELRES